jgi:transcriptional regulator with XRE-family HTH domain
MSGRAQHFANGGPGGDAGLKEQVAARFAKNLRACRTRADVTQEDLSRRASVHRNQVGLLEGGTRLPRIDTVIKLACALSVPPEELLKGIDWKPDYTQRGRSEFQ